MSISGQSNLLKTFTCARAGGFLLAAMMAGAPGLRAASFIDAFPARDDGWRFSEWMGWVLPAGHDDWYFHYRFGWFRTSAADPASFWIFDPQMGFLWSSDRVFPNFHDPLRQRFLSWNPEQAEPRLFYDWLRAPAEWVEEQTLFFPDVIFLPDQRRTENRGVVRQFTLAYEIPVLRITTANGTGDGDVFLKRGGTAEIDNFDYHSRNFGNTEEVVIFNAPAGEYSLRVEAAGDEPANYFAELDVTIDFLLGYGPVSFAPATGTMGGAIVSFWTYPGQGVPGGLADYLNIEVDPGSGTAYLLEPFSADAFNPSTFAYARSGDLSAELSMSFSTSGEDGPLSGSVTYSLFFTSATAGVFSAVFQISDGGASGAPVGTHSSAGAFQLY